MNSYTYILGVFNFFKKSSSRSQVLRDAIFPTRERENGLFKESFFEKAVFPFSRGKNRISQGVENRGSLISVPLSGLLLLVYSVVAPAVSPGVEPMHRWTNQCSLVAKAAALA